MKNSIGSLAALAAFAVPAVAEAAPEVASFSNVALPYETSGSVDFDVDNNGANDFYVFSNSNSVGLEAYGDTLFTDSSVSFGSVVSTGGPTTAFILLEDVGVPSVGASYYGLTFTRDGQTHTAWVLFDFTGDPKLTTSAAWENAAGQSISVGAVPEPSAFAVLAGAGALAVVSLRRRRKSRASDSL